MSGFMLISSSWAPGRHASCAYGVNRNQKVILPQSDCGTKWRTTSASALVPYESCWVPMAAQCCGTTLVLRRNRLGDRHQELGVALGLAEPVQQHLQPLQAFQARKDAPQLPHDGQLLATHQQLLAAGAGCVDVDRWEDPLLGELATQPDLGVAGALELLEDHLVHLRAGLDQSRCDDGERSATLDVAGG